MQKLVRENDYSWTFMHFSSQPDVIKNYDIRAYPSYFLISPSGELILSPAPAPSQNFEGVFLKMISGK